MKIKLLIFTLLTIITVLLSGCDKGQSYITIHNGEWHVLNDSTVLIDSQYIFKDFSKECKDGKCIVTVIFDKVKENK